MSVSTYCNAKNIERTAEGIDDLNKYVADLHDDVLPRHLGCCTVSALGLNVGVAVEAGGNIVVVVVGDDIVVVVVEAGSNIIVEAGSNVIVEAGANIIIVTEKIVSMRILELLINYRSDLGAGAEITGASGTP